MMHDSRDRNFLYCTPALFALVSRHSSQEQERFRVEHQPACFDTSSLPTALWQMMRKRSLAKGRSDTYPEALHSKTKHAFGLCFHVIFCFTVRLILDPGPRNRFCYMQSFPRGFRGVQNYRPFTTKACISKLAKFQIASKHIQQAAEFFRVCIPLHKMITNVSENPTCTRRTQAQTKGWHIDKSTFYCSLL